MSCAGRDPREALEASLAPCGGRVVVRAYAVAWTSCPWVMGCRLMILYSV